MAPVILVTFAGRQERMSLLDVYARQALESGLIDEWHLWDFTRNQSDHRWLSENFGPIRFMKSEVGYQKYAELNIGSPTRIRAKVKNDLHIAILPHNAPDYYIEVIIGGWGNSGCAIRILPRSVLYTWPHQDDASTVFVETPGILSAGSENDISLSIDQQQKLHVTVNNIDVGHWGNLNLDQGASVLVRSGWSADLEFCGIRTQIQRFIGTPDERMPYWAAYDYYNNNFAEYQNAVFLKCDDDVVFMNLDKLGDFIQFRKQNPHYFIVSANVVNNGVCAFLQQKAGSIPTEVDVFEYPPGGKGGSLWGSSEKAFKLHQFFLGLPEKQLPLENSHVEWNERHSINFISWLGADLPHLRLPKGDDERFISVDIPRLLKRPCAIYSDFIVSHLSFGAQENGLNIEELIKSYKALLPAPKP